jgi:type I restriction enzyme, R subunit
MRAGLDLVLEICNLIQILNAIMRALDAHNAMSTQALNSEEVQQGLKDVLLNNAGLYTSLRAQKRM